MFSLHFFRFQNGSFCTFKWPILSRRMIHFGEQNGPFSDAKRLVLNDGKIFSAILFLFFTEGMASVFVE